MTFGNKMEQKKTLTSEQFFSLSLSRTNTLLKAGFPSGEATYNPCATPGYRTTPIGCLITTFRM
jgi:hypothetical protein